MNDRDFFLDFGWFRNSRNRAAHYYAGTTLAACGSYAQAKRPESENRHVTNGPQCGGCLAAIGK